MQNPNEHGGNRDRSELVDGILRQAHSGSEERAGAAAQQRESWGLGHTLGSDEVESQTVGEVEENEEEVQRRTLTFWRDGFSIEDGDLYRYDDPANMQLLAAIQAGRAPVSLFNVNYDQALELVINERRGEMYSPLPKKPAAAFSGEGNRLGSAVPTFSGANTPTNASGAASPAPAAASSPAAIQLDASKPAANVQLRLGDGSRLVARVNLDHTVADLGAFIAQ